MAGLEPSEKVSNVVYILAVKLTFSLPLPLPPPPPLFFSPLSLSFSSLLVQVHVNVIVVDARMQAELIYGMRALMRFMKS